MGGSFKTERWQFCSGFCIIAIAIHSVDIRVLEINPQIFQKMFKIIAQPVYDVDLIETEFIVEEGTNSVWDLGNRKNSIHYLAKHGFTVHPNENDRKQMRSRPCQNNDNTFSLGAAGLSVISFESL